MERVGGAADEWIEGLDKDVAERSKPDEGGGEAVEG
jgi:hypothetical protein